MLFNFTFSTNCTCFPLVSIARYTSVNEISCHWEFRNKDGKRAKERVCVYSFLVFFFQFWPAIPLISEELFVHLLRFFAYVIYRFFNTYLLFMLVIQDGLTLEHECNTLITFDPFITYLCSDLTPTTFVPFKPKLYLNMHLLCKAMQRPEVKSSQIKSTTCIF